MDSYFEELLRIDDRLTRIQDLLNSIADGDYPSVPNDARTKAGERSLRLTDAYLKGVSTEEARYQWLSDFDRKTVHALSERMNTSWRNQLADGEVAELRKLAENYPDDGFAEAVNTIARWPEPIEQAYLRWVGGPKGYPSLEDWTDEFRFYGFVWACVEDPVGGPSHVAVEARLKQRANLDNQKIAEASEKAIDLMRNLELFAYAHGGSPEGR